MSVFLTLARFRNVCTVAGLAHAILITSAGPTPTGAAMAQAQAPSVAADEPILADRRLAAGYLRTGNGDLAALALERLQKSLPAPYSARVATALAAIDAGDLAAAAAATEALAADLSAARRAAGTRLLADCVRELSDTFAALDRHRTKHPDLADATTGAAITTAAKDSDAAFARCDAEAPAPVKTDADFRRIVDGARASLARVPEAVAARDGDLLHRFLIELRAYEQILKFRHG